MRPAEWSMKRGLWRATAAANATIAGSQHARDGTSGPRPTITGRGETAGIERPGDRHLRFKALTPQAADDPSCFLRPPRIERTAHVG